MSNILLCEDDEEILHWLINSFIDMGAKVVATDGGDEALATWKGHRPFDFIVTDLSFRPGNLIKHGLDLVQAVHEIDPSQRIVIQTGNIPLVVPCGVGLVYKPYPFHRLVRTMKRMPTLPLFEAR